MMSSVTKEQDLRLKAQFPLVFRALRVRRRRSADTIVGRRSIMLPLAYGTECGPGWYALVASLARTLERQIVHLPARRQRGVFATQVKEKFGHLRFYMSTSNDAMDAAIHRARERSLRVCEDCGRPGRLHRGKWLVTRCDDHASRWVGA
jgi:hypothetical protein